MLMMPVLSLSEPIEECAEWWACPYVSPDGMPTDRELSLRGRLRFKWSEIEVDGNQALVCLSRPMPAGDTWGCTEVNRGQVRALLQPPKMPYFDGTEIKFSEEILPFNPRAIHLRIRDSAIDSQIIRGRNPQ